MDQLFDLDPVPAAAAPARVPPSRRSSKGIAPGDIVEVDRKGRRFLAHVLEVEQRDTGFHDLRVRPVERGVSYRTATIHEVVAVWRRAEP